MSVTLMTPTDPAFIDRAAEAAYVATMTLSPDHPRYEPWQSLPEYWRRIYRAQAKAILEVLT